MVATADGVQERGLSAGMSEIAATHGEAVDAVRRKNMARPDAGTEFLGVRRTRTGKYAAQIWEPLGRINVWLGTFGTAEDAAKAYTAAAAEMQAAESVIKKNTAAAELQAAELAARMKAAAELQASERAVKKKTAAELQAAEGAVKNKTAAAGPGAWTKFHGVRRQPSGKYTATIWHPSRRSQEYLGTFDTAEDAAKAYDAAAVKLPCMRKPVKKDATGRPYARTEFRGVSRTTNGKYQATITQSNGKARMWLGTFATAEEAARAYDAAAVKLHGAAAKTNFRVDDGIGVQAVRQEKTAPSVFRGVSQQQNGKYRARIRDPVQRARLCLGIFDKAEDAAHAYDAEAVRLHGERAITNFKRPFVDLKDFPELPALDFFSDTIFPGAQFDDLWTDLPEAELQPVDELLKDMEFDDVAA